MRTVRSVEDLEDGLKIAWPPATSPKWRADNPALGQCSVTALLVQDLFGGQILNTRVGTQWHFYSRIPGQRRDLTASQFGRGIACDDVAGNRRDAMTDTTPGHYAALREGPGPFAVG
jgi:hypothetical protein